ncbi:MAG: hypothetical protein SCK29_13770 [Bacillota bacterium]|nr:hypothetical protein [Bacillota bacterium]MDW7685171.1 hypothetical protein [Bacillota bacterium]
MRQAPVKPAKKERPFPALFVGFLLVISLLAAGATLLLSAPREDTSVPSMEEMISAKAAVIAETNQYDLTIEESGPGYTIRFVGQVSDSKLYGKIDAYDLEVFSDREKYFVKGASVFTDWEEAGKAELDALSVLVRNPIELLQVLTSGDRFLVEEGPDRLVDDVNCRTYFLEIPPPDIQMVTRFEDEDATLDKLQLYLWFNEDGNFMHRMAMLLNVTVEGENIQVNRIYSLSPRSKELPEDLPQVDEDVLAI